MVELENRNGVIDAFRGWMEAVFGDDATEAEFVVRDDADGDFCLVVEITAKR